MSVNGESYEVYALRYGSAKTTKSSKYLNYKAYGEPDEEIVADFYFWLVRNKDRTILVDCGFDDERARPRGYFQTCDPVELLARFGVTPAEVDHVVISHMHFDHIGNIGLFPNATFTVSRDEFDFWTGRYAKRKMFALFAEAEEIEMLVELDRAGRVHFVEGAEAETIFPGITVTPIRGHTPGQMITEIENGQQNLVLASDALHFYEEKDRDRPFWVYCDLEGMYDGYERLNELSQRPDTVVVAGHDPEVMRRFKMIDDDCVDLTVALVE
ncbi:N-acyl homoserine lactonase family protein [Nocardia sp. NPDC058518]|uniref:N-acyl homoserine lactonase family protein n=1 Tax=Nocardia sp. NPDC058518 TaxID=3346534 RepID=UPI003660E6C2